MVEVIEGFGSVIVIVREEHRVVHGWDYYMIIMRLIIISYIIWYCIGEFARHINWHLIIERERERTNWQRSY